MDTGRHSLTPQEFLARLGRPDAPRVLDVRRSERFAQSQRLLPSAAHCLPERVEALADGREEQDWVVYCVHGHEVSQGAAAMLRAAGGRARHLEGGIEAMVEAGLPTLRKRPDLGVTGESPSRWITRARPKIDRVACPWLIRRFIDPRAEFFYVPAEQVFAEAKRLQAVAYDIPGAGISHEGDHCSFDALLQAFDLRIPALSELARIVRGADTGQLQLAPQAPGLLALSLGLSRLHEDDQRMLEQAMPMYDALYAWCREAQAEAHSWKPESMPGAPS